MTAVEWLDRWFRDNPEATHEEGNKALQQAKEMETNQIIRAFNKGAMQPQRMGTDYFDETYGSNGSDELSKVEENTIFDTSSKTEMIKKAEWLLDELNKNK